MRPCSANAVLYLLDLVSLAFYWMPFDIKLKGSPKTTPSRSGCHIASAGPFCATNARAAVMFDEAIIRQLVALRLPSLDIQNAALKG